MMPRKKPPEANPWDALQDIEDALDDYTEMHPEWQTQPSGAVVEEVTLTIHRLYTAASKGRPMKRRRKQPKPARPSYGPDDIPF